MRQMRVHPLADAFPMMPDDELEELAEDIRANGLNEPLVIDKEGRLIDGRNRLAACDKASVKPKFRTYEGSEAEVTALILSANVRRRHLSKGMCAMAVAIARPDPDKGGRGRERSTSEVDVSRTSLNRARAVLREFGADSDVVRQVMAGGSLNDAYEAAQKQKRLRDEQEQALKSLRLMMEEVGPSRPINVTDSDLNPAFDISELGKEFSKELFPKVELQQKYLGFMIGIVNQLERASRETVVEEGWASESYFIAVQSAASQIIGHAKAIADAHKKAADKPRIRKVK